MDIYIANGIVKQVLFFNIEIYFIKNPTKKNTFLFIRIFIFYNHTHYFYYFTHEFRNKNMKHNKNKGAIYVY